ncbi:MAG: hypothetical protein IJB97_09480 [Clostridia bacterium]|nr:hypothetical protein [Clostridia bacterium]
MKKRNLRFTAAVAALCAAFCGVSLVGCGLGAGDSGDLDIPDYNADVQTVAPEEITVEHFVAEENVTYYTSESLSLWMEVNGEYLEMDYFSLDGDKRVYDHLYLYKNDYFYMLSDDLTGWYAALDDSTDPEYAEVEKDQGYDVQVNVKKSGIYKLTFDVKTLKFDMEYKSEITEPVYYTMKNCSIFTLATNWVEMAVNPANADEFVIQNFNIEAGALVGFFNYVHTSNYKVTLDESCDGKYVSGQGINVWANVGGVYNVYINAKTYVARFELLNPDTATYSCVYYDGAEFKTLQPYDVSVPYIFRQRVVVDTDYTTSLPKFHSEKYQTYALTAVDPTDVLINGEKDAYFKKKGVYDVIVNLKTFEITAELLPE